MVFWMTLFLYAAAITSQWFTMRSKKEIVHQVVSSFAAIGLAFHTLIMVDVGVGFTGELSGEMYSLILAWICMAVYFPLRWWGIPNLINLTMLFVGFWAFYLGKNGLKGALSQDLILPLQGSWFNLTQIGSGIAMLMFFFTAFLGIYYLVISIQLKHKSFHDTLFAFPLSLQHIEKYMRLMLIAAFMVYTLTQIAIGIVAEHYWTTLWNWRNQAFRLVIWLWFAVAVALVLPRKIHGRPMAIHVIFGGALVVVYALVFFLRIKFKGID